MNSQSKSQMLDKFVPYYPTKDTRKFPIFSSIINNFNIWRLQRKFKQELQQTPVILVYQMGKVGSANPYLAIKKTFPEKAVYHVHNLNPKIVAKIWDKINPTSEGVEGTTETQRTQRSIDHIVS
ncbi:capsular polysaccharide biosynthesis protein [Microcystis aeruginosa CS-338/01]|uniref:capsular polysaccharide biosynthesis protein n=1 Tax=Microcystis aeruginosa TaxID=1126 RepID=UPI00232F71AC|nr:capsular polysaccharide biosynthesis protein [Microcystis aeruginosa]MDB9507213.1 capsular polysaccharide biosynthesis protein [Microcystis aeruginosa CS-338/01]